MSMETRREWLAVMSGGLMMPMTSQERLQHVEVLRFVIDAQDFHGVVLGESK